MNDTLRLVAAWWYRLYYGWMLLLCVALVVGVVASHVVPGVASLAEMFGLSKIHLVLAGVCILYNASFFWALRRRSEPMAMLVGAMVFSFVVLAGISSAQTPLAAWVFVSIWLVSTFFSGMFGLSLSLGSVLFAGVYAAMQTKFGATAVTPQTIAILGGSVMAAGFGIWFWKHRFIDPNSVQLSKLSGMLKSNQEQSAILIQSIADGVIVTDTEGKISLMNQSASNMTGWTIQEAATIDVQQVLKLNSEKGQPLAENEYPFDAVLVRKAFINQILQVTSRSGRQRIISLVISPVVTPTGEVYGAVAVMRDVSEERAAEMQRAEFISTASHEMRTPVAAIEGYLALALNAKVSTIDSRAKGFLEKAHASTQHLGKLFQDLLTSAKAEDGRLSSHPAVVEMGTFLEQLIEDLRFTAEKKGLLVEFSVGGNKTTIDATSENQEGIKVVKPLYYSFADPERLREAATNLFDNAIKYTEQGKITVGLTGDQEVVQFFVHDTGPGIPADDIPHLFQKFYRVDNSATRVIGGTGLGLFICRKIVELYGGRIWVESELGKGSTFYINLPRLSTQKATQMMSNQDAAAPAMPTLPTTS